MSWSKSSSCFLYEKIKETEQKTNNKNTQIDIKIYINIIIFLEVFYFYQNNFQFLVECRMNESKIVEVLSNSNLE